METLTPHGRLTLERRVRVATPEHVVFEYAVAGLASRFGAFVLDAALSAAVAVVGLLLIAAAQRTSVGEAKVGLTQGLTALLGFVVVFAAQWAYYVVSEWALGGQTLGKRVFGLRVVTTDGRRLRFMESVVRNVLRLVDAFPVAAVVATAHPLLNLAPLFILPGAVAAFLSARHQRLGDLAAGTLVVAESRGARRTQAASDGGEHNRFLGDATITTRVRRHLHPEAADFLLTLCARRDTLELDARLALFHDAATRLERATGLEKPAELSDEKYVSNLVEVMRGGGPAR